MKNNPNKEVKSTISKEELELLIASVVKYYNKLMKLNNKEHKIIDTDPTQGILDIRATIPLHLFGELRKIIITGFEMNLPITFIEKNHVPHSTVFEGHLPTPEDVDSFAESRKKEVEKIRLTLEDRIKELNEDGEKYRNLLKNGLKHLNEAINEGDEKAVMAVLKIMRPFWMSKVDVGQLFSAAKALVNISKKIGKYFPEALSVASGLEERLKFAKASAGWFSRIKNWEIPVVGIYTKEIDLEIIARELIRTK